MSDRSAVGRKSKRKGAAGELELAKLLQTYGYEARRGYQFDGKYVADVVGLPGVHIECKRVEKLNMMDALRQSARDAKGDELPAVFHRRNREPWQVTMVFDDWIQLYREARDEE